MKIIKYTQTLDVRNIDLLPAGTGAKYLEVIRGQKQEYIAKQWKRKTNKSGIFIKF